MSIIKVKNLSKEFKQLERKQGFTNSLKSLFVRKYKTVTAVDDISFSINKGECIGYIGPNGAGKSTTIKMLVGILVPTSGEIEVNGLVPYRDRKELTRRIGVVFGQRTQLWWDIPVIETYNLLKYIYRIPQDKYEKNLKLFSDILDINKFLNTPVRQLSLGQRMRADLCASFLHDPELIFLDEPTIGLDIIAKQNIRDFISHINETREATIIITTHDMSDIEKLCSHIMIIDRGRIMYNGSLSDIKINYGSEEIINIELEDNGFELDEIYDLKISEVIENGTKITIRYDNRIISSSKIINWFTKRSEIKDFEVHKTEIEEIIKKMYRSNDISKDTGKI